MYPSQFLEKHFPSQHLSQFFYNECIWLPYFSLELRTVDRVTMKRRETATQSGQIKGIVKGSRTH